MGFRFRKSINLGGGFRVNLSKSGVGYSWGTKGVRFTKTAKGKRRTTSSIPGTGISYVTESNGTKITAPRQPKNTTNIPALTPDNNENGGNGMVWIRFIICLLFGIFGVHKFMEKKIGMGILYLFTAGLFGLGWFYDCIKYFCIAIKNTKRSEKVSVPESESYGYPVTEYPPVEIPVKRGFSIKKLLLWIIVVFLGLMALAFLPHISSILALAAAVLLLPVEKWQGILSRFVKGKSKAIIATVVAVAAFFATPTADTPEVDRSNPNSAVVETGEVIELATLPPTEVTTEPPAELEGISFLEESYIVGVGRTVDIPFVLQPENAVSNDLEAFVDNAESAFLTFDKNGERIIQVTGVIPGEATITLCAGNAIIATKTITVAEVMPEGITINAEPQVPQVGSTGMLTAVFDPLDVTNQIVAWQSDAPEVLIINEDGSYEALSIGEATITATHENGVVGTLLMKVLPVEAERVQLNSDWEEGNSFTKGKTMTLTANVYPENTTDKSITWTSSDESVATVSDKGVVKAVAHGSVVITAMTSNGKTSTYEIRVDPTPQKFKVSYSIKMQSNDHVGSNWTKGCEYNGEEISSGTVLSIMPGETFTIFCWAEENDSRPDYGSYGGQMTLTNEMCEEGFTVEGEADVRENGGRYSGHYAVWYVKITFKPVN